MDRGNFRCELPVRIHVDISVEYLQLTNDDGGNDLEMPSCLRYVVLDYFLYVEYNRNAFVMSPRARC